MNTNKPLITDPAEFIKDAYAALSPNWDTLTGKEQFDIINAKFAAIASGTTTVNGVLPSDTPDATYRQFASSLAKGYIFEQAENNEAVGELLGIKDVTALTEAE